MLPVRSLLPAHEARDVSRGGSHRKAQAGRLPLIQVARPHLAVADIPASSVPCRPRASASEATIAPGWRLSRHLITSALW